MSTRLPAAERRAAVVETACRIFAKGSYRGSTTAQIARELGIKQERLRLIKSRALKSFRESYNKLRKR